MGEDNVQASIFRRAAVYGALLSTCAWATGCGTEDTGGTDQAVAGGAATDGTADVSVTSVSLANPVSDNGQLVWSVTLTNAGPNDAANVSLDGFNASSDYAAPTVNIVSAEPGQGACSFSAVTVECSLGDLPVGASTTVIVTGTPSGPGEVVVRWTADHDTTDPDETNNVATDTTTIIDGSADPAVVSVVSSTTAGATGAPLTYTVTATNNGPTAATGVELGFVIDDPSAATGISASADSGACTASSAGATCGRLALAVGASWTMTVELTPTVAGDLAGSATISTASGGDSDLGNNSQTFTTPIVVGSTVDVSAEVSDAADPVALNDAIVYTLTTTNHGLLPAPDVTLTQQFTVPSSVAFVSASSADASCAQAQGNGPIVCTLNGDLAPGASVSVDVLATALVAGTVTTTVTAATSATDDDATNDSATTTTDVITAVGADMALTLTDAPDPLVTGAEVTYTATATNHGPQTATDGTLLLALPAGVTNAVVSTPTGTCSVTGQVASCTFPDLVAGSSVAVTVTANVTSAGGTVLIASGMVDAAQNDSNESNDAATTETVVISAGGADLGVSITATPNPVLAGELLEYQVRFYNAGSSPAASAEGLFAVPPTMELISVELIAGGADESCVFNPVTNAVACNFETFPMSRVAIGRIVVRAGGNPAVAPANGEPYNFVAASAANVDVPSGDGVDGNEANDNALQQTTVFVCETDNPCVTVTLGSTGGVYACEFVDNDGGTCGQACFEDGICQGGTCQLGPAVTCGGDDNECTQSACDPATGQCSTVNVDGPCAGDDLCITGKACLNGQCVGGVPVDCADDGNVCTSNACDPATGQCESEMVLGSCDDADPCTRNDQCTNGTCAGDPLVCDDGDPCTDDVCDPAQYGGCGFVPNTAACDDGDPCTTNDACNLGTCSGSAVACDDGNPCTTDVCDATQYGGCGYINNSDSCNDGDACTDNDTCVAGACVGSAKSCNDGNECTADSCDTNGSCVNEPTPNITCGQGVCTGAYCGDLNICDGVPTCDAAGECVQTPIDCDDGDPCTVDSCDPASGACSHEALDCSDQNTECSVFSCDAQSGACVAIPNHLACDDGNSCTSDQCVDGSCTNTPNAGDPCSFGECDGDDCETNLCDGEPTCNEAGECIQEAVACDDGDPCTDDLCDPASGACTFAPVDCTGLNSECAQFACEPTTGQCAPTHSDASCDDGNPCTTDACDTASGACTHEQVDCSANNTECLSFSCNAATGQCVPSESVYGVCDDGNPCTDDACDTASGECVHIAVACDDGDACNGAETCHPTTGACVTSGPLDCADDMNPCTDQYCDPVQGCVTVNNTAPCDDGSECTTGDVCSAGVCTGGPTLDCPDDGNPCTSQACNPTEGCVVVNNNAACDDGNACTEDDYCMAGTCQAGATLGCDDDDNPCTDVGCDPAQGCVTTTPTRPCDDGNSCTDGDMCTAGECVPGQGEECVDDGNPCTTQFCDPVEGCKTVFNNAPCDDGNACTLGDMCSEGSCEPGDAATCSDDGNPCTTEQCDPVAGCQHVDNNDPCDDDNACTSNDMCSNGTCFGGAAVTCTDDGNVCTDTECDPGQGCVHVNNTLPCSDGNACTTGDTCSAGACGGDTPTSCDDGNACTVDSCDAAQGCLNTADDTACDDGNPCTEDSCDPAQGCVHTPTAGPCDDGNACNDSCSQFGPGVQKVWSLTNTKGGQGSHGLWLHSFVTDGKILRMTLQSDAYLVWYTNNTAKITGTVAVSSLGGGGGNMGESWTLDLDLTYRGQGEAGEGSGGPKGINDDSVTDHWKYFDLLPTSRIIRSDSNGTDYLSLTQYPANSKHPFQVGEHADLHDTGFGAAVWYQWQRVTNGTTVRSGNGDLNASLVDYDCVSDMCQAGQCVGGTGDADCDDNNPCTDDACDPQLGCVHTPNDGNACDDGNACTDNFCAQGQCQATDNDDPCDDGMSCNDACAEFPFTQAVKKSWTINNVSGGRIFWLPGFYGNGKALMSAEAGSYIVWLDDNTLQMWGTSKVVSLGGGAGTLGADYNFEFTFTYRGKGDAGVGSGGPKLYAGSDATNWEYFDMTSGRLELASSPSTHFATFEQRPAGSIHPFQVGAGGGHVVPEFGGATWVNWSHTAGNHTYTGTGDINMRLVDYACQGVDYCSAGVCGAQDVCAP